MRKGKGHGDMETFIFQIHGIFAEVGKADVFSAKTSVNVTVINKLYPLCKY